MLFEMELWLSTTLVGMAFIAGLFSAIAGAGGMITLPLLLWAGLPPINAIATNKVQSTMGTMSSTLNFFRKKQLDFTHLKYGMCFALLGSLTGVWVLRQLGNDVLVSLLPVLLILAALYFLVSPTISDQQSKQRISHKRFNVVVGGGMGFYGGFFGPGMATFYALAYVSLLGYNAVKATAHTKPLVLVTNGSAALVFIITGDVIWDLAIAMAAAQIIGARLGSNMVLSHGAAIVRPALIVGSMAMAIKLLFFP
ncbi:MAG: TSUP family transporter [Pseudomonadales bacterium]